MAMNTRTSAFDLAVPGLKLVLAAEVFVLARVEIEALHHRQRAAVDHLFHVQKQTVLLRAFLCIGAWNRR